MLGQPVYFLTPDVVGVHLTGALREGVTATDLALHVTQMLRKAKVVGKFVEFFGPGAARCRSWIGRPSQHGAGIWRDDGLLPRRRRVRRITSAPRAAARSMSRLYENYYKAQGLWGFRIAGQIDYSQICALDLAEVVPSVAGPKRPQDRIDLPELRRELSSEFQHPVTESGYRKEPGGTPLKVTTYGSAAREVHPSGCCHDPGATAGIALCTERILRSTGGNGSPIVPSPTRSGYVCRR